MAAHPSMPIPNPAPTPAAPSIPETGQVSNAAPVTMPTPSAAPCSPGFPVAGSGEQKQEQSSPMPPKPSQPMSPPVHSAQNAPPPMYAAAPPMGPGVGPQPLITDVALGSQYQAEVFGRCARGRHEPTRKFGPCGIITAIFCFPIGLICLFTDTHKECSRCGARIA